jgi:uncharacterized membrane protein
MRLVGKGFIIAVVGAVLLGLAQTVSAQPIQCHCPFSPSYCILFWIC